MTGWQVVQVAELSLCDFWNLNRSQVYRELAKLADSGLIEAGEKGVRDQIPYSITDAGREAFLEWLNEDPGPEITRSPIHLKLSFAEHLDDETCARFVRIHRRRNEERLDYYRQLERTISDSRPYETLVLRSGITYREGLLSWLDSLPWGRRSANARGPARR
jgi:DNA-binding PadR family transcriptional regulator